MSVYTLKIYVEDPGTKRMQRQSRQLQVNAPDPDRAMKQARELLAKSKYPAIRSINVGPDNVLVIYCAEVPRATPPEGVDHRYKRPPGPKRI
jgi:hypothetical protein